MTRRDRRLAARRVPSGMLARRTAVVAVALVLVAAAFCGVQLSRQPPAPVLHGLVQASVTVPGPPPNLPWPTQGQAAVDVVGVGTFGPVGGDQAVPVASLAKIMTALVVLGDHPLPPGVEGPPLSITPADVTVYRNGAAVGDSEVAVRAGEALSERQAIEGLLVPSADNLAGVLAKWDAGSEAAFVDKMNARAASMGLTKTHYADVSGLDPATVSTASDQLRLAEAAMAIPAFAQTVGLAQVALPVAGTVHNYNRLVGQDGIVGIKTGSTAAAGGCFAFAANRVVDGHPATIVGVVLGQHGGSLINAGLSASQRVLDATGASLIVLRGPAAGQPQAKLVAPWGKSAPVGAAGMTGLVAWPGLVLRARVIPGPLQPGMAAGSVVGHVSYQLGHQRAQLPLRLSQALPGPSLAWRLGRL